MLQKELELFGCKGFPDDHIHDAGCLRVSEISCCERCQGSAGSRPALQSERAHAGRRSDWPVWTCDLRNRSRSEPGAYTVVSDLLFFGRHTQDGGGFSCVRNSWNKGSSSSMLADDQSPDGECLRGSECVSIARDPRSDCLVPAILVPIRVRMMATHVDLSI